MYVRKNKVDKVLILKTYYTDMEYSVVRTSEEKNKKYP